MSFVAEIPLHPTEFTFDLWIVDNVDECIKQARKRYGLSNKSAAELFEHKQCVQLIECGKKREIKHKVQMGMNLQPDSTNGTIVHECYHLLHYLAYDCNLPLTYEDQEWGAQMIDYIFRQVEKAIRT